MEIPNCFYRVSAKALILDETRTKFLLTKEETCWELPGGGMDFGETPHDTIVREVAEEMGLSVAWLADRPSYVVSSPMQRVPGAYALNIIYETKLTHLNFTASPECEEALFATLDVAVALPLHPGAAYFVQQFDPKNHTV